MTPDPRRRAGIAALAAAAAHLPSLGGVFQFDDYNVIVNDPTIHSWSGLLAGMGTGVRPLLKASYALCWSWGIGPIGFHAFNIAVHAANAALLYAIGRKIAARWLKTPAAVDHAALGAALLFALHPAQSEAVTYISGRSVSFMALFALGAILAHLEGRRLAAAVLFILALCVKETALILPAVLLLCDAFTGPRGWKGFARRQAGVLTVFLIATAAFFLAPRSRDLITYGFTQRGPLDNLLSQIGGIVYLLARLVTLHGYNVDPNLPPFHAWTFAVVVQALVLVSLAAAAVLSLRKRPWMSFGIAWFFLQLVPTNSIVPRLDVANDRQLYLACWGLFLALSVETARLRPSLALKAASAAVLAVFAAASIARQGDYASEIALWESSLRVSPGNARALNNLGMAYQEAGRRADAEASYRAAIRLRPDYLKARVNLRLLRWDDAP